MRNKVYGTFDEAVKDMPDGSTIMFAGFGPPGMPRNLIAALLRKGPKRLTAITNVPGRRGNYMDVGKLVEAGCVKRLICPFTAAPHPSQAHAFEKLYEAGEIEGELVPQGTLAERIRAGGAGIGAFYTPTGVGTETAEGKRAQGHRWQGICAGVPSARGLLLCPGMASGLLRQPSVSPVPA